MKDELLTSNSLNIEEECRSAPQFYLIIGATLLARLSVLTSLSGC